ncbi:MAG: YbjN domain-containing protein [Alphaproteobacteria bacterium]|nr:YbjN domain-containing protein [Alphaproteobacteria bacterium]
MTALLALALALAPSAEAKPLPKHGITLDDVDGFAHAVGLATERVTFDDGQTVVRITMGDSRVDAYLLLCDDAGRCGDLQFVMGWSLSDEGMPTLERVNEWNAKHRYVRASLGPENTLWGKVDVSLRPGGSRELVLDYMRFVGTDLVPAFNTWFGLP